MALKTFRPTTPSLRQLVQVDRSHLWKGAPIKMLTEGKTKSGGRNNYGRITTRHIGGGHKQAYRNVDFKRTQARRGGEGRAAGVRPQPHGVHRAAEVQGRHAGLHPGAAAAGRRRQGRLRRQGGREARQRHAAASMPIGTIVHNIELKAGGGGKIARSAGTYAQLVGRDAGWAILRLNSGRDAPRACRVHGDRRCGVQSRSHERGDSARPAARAGAAPARPCARSP